jgi:O-antigen ligase
MSLKTVLVFILVVIFSASVFPFVLKTVPDVERISPMISISSLEIFWEHYKVSRLDDAIKPAFQASLESSAHLPFLGLGKGYVGEAHNQYLRNFIETGIIGSLIFLILIFALIRKSWQGFSKSTDGLVVGLSAGLLVATLSLLFISFATEPFIVVKPSSVYWFFAGITVAALSLNKK